MGPCSASVRYSIFRQVKLNLRMNFKSRRVQTTYGLLHCPSLSVLISHATAHCPDTPTFQPHFSFSNQPEPQTVIAVSASWLCFESRSIWWEQEGDGSQNFTAKMKTNATTLHFSELESTMHDIIFETMRGHFPSHSDFGFPDGCTCTWNCHRQQWQWAALSQRKPYIHILVEVWSVS